MKLGSFSVGFPLYEIKSEVTYQTIRSPTVFERMVMKLCGHYRAAPGIAEMTLSQIFEQQLGVASANELVRPSVENLVYIGVLSRPVSQDYMALRLAEMSLTADGVTFLERDRLPSRSQQTSVSHLFFPLSNSVKAQRVDDRLPQTPGRLFVGDAVLHPSDCSLLVREAVAKERHAWRTPNTEIHSVQSRVVGVVWEQHQISLECDESGVLAIKAKESPDLDRWLAVANPDAIWQHILEPIVASDVSSDWPIISEAVFRSALEIAPQNGGRKAHDTALASPKTALRVLVDEAELVGHIDQDLVLLKKQGHVVQRLSALFKSGNREIRRLPSKQGTIWLEMTEPSELPAGFSGLLIHKDDLSPELHLTGLAKVFWAGKHRRAAVTLTADKDTSAQVWNALQTELKSGLSIKQSADVYAVASLWEPPQETILHWRARVDSLPLGELIVNASDFISSLKRFSPHTREDWRTVWLSALADRLMFAISRLDTKVELGHALSYLAELDRLMPTQSSEIKSEFLSHSSAISDLASLKMLREAAGSAIILPDGIIDDTILLKWISDALTDTDLTLYGPHSYERPIMLIRSAHHDVLRDVGLKSLQDAASGALSLRGVKTSALGSVTKWQEARTTVRGMRATLMDAAFSPIDQFDRLVSVWRELATRQLAHPGMPGQRLVVLDTSALMLVPGLLSGMRRNDIPVVARRVLEELDGIKESTEEEKAQKARAAIRSLERAGQTVRYESEVLELLPADWEPTPDNRILSVALYLRLSDVIMVTGDRNFRNKARAENIVAMMPNEYTGVSPNQEGRRGTGGRRH